MILLDTHILLWWHLNFPKLGEKRFGILEKLESKKENVWISIISFWEIAKLASLGRMSSLLSLDELFKELEEHPFVKVLPLTSAIILESIRLGPNFHKDPADQLIVATARVHGLRLMTMDEKIIDSGLVAIT